MVCIGITVGFIVSVEERDGPKENTITKVITMTITIPIMTHPAGVVRSAVPALAPA